VFLQVVDEPSPQAAGFTLVYVPTAVRNAGQGFRFTLPERALGQEAPGETAVSTLPNGDALPGWLSFEGNSHTFIASSVPPGGLPLRVRVLSGSKSILIELLETNS
jgi:hypothetical protein